MHRKRLWAQGLLMTILTFSKNGYLSARAFAIANTTVIFMIPPLYLVAFKYFCTSVLIWLSSEHERPPSLWLALSMEIYSVSFHCWFTTCNTFLMIAQWFRLDWVGLSPNFDRRYHTICASTSFHLYAFHYKVILISTFFICTAFIVSYVSFRTSIQSGAAV